MHSFQNLLAKLILVAVLSGMSASHAANDVALVTAVQGKVSRTSSSGPSELEAFVKLKRGDLLQLEKGSTLRLVYFESGRQESWNGDGKLEIVATESKGIGLTNPEVKVLPTILVKQIAKTPSLDSQGRAGVMRLRSIPTTKAIAQLEQEYAQMRKISDPGDMNPEIFLLSGLFEMRALDRVEAVLGELQESRKNEMEARVLVSLYRKALKDVKEKN